MISSSSGILQYRPVFFILCKKYFYTFVVHMYVDVYVKTD